MLSRSERAGVLCHQLLNALVNLLFRLEVVNKLKGVRETLPWLLVVRQHARLGLYDELWNSRIIKNRTHYTKLRQESDVLSSTLWAVVGISGHIRSIVTQMRSSCAKQLVRRAVAAYAWNCRPQSTTITITFAPEKMYYYHLQVFANTLLRYSAAVISGCNLKLSLKFSRQPTKHCRQFL